MNVNGRYIYVIHNFNFSTDRKFHFKFGGEQQRVATLGIGGNRLTLGAQKSVTYFLSYNFSKQINMTKYL